MIKAAARRASRGLSLIEVVVVAAILGVIATIVVVAYSHGRETSAVWASEASIRQVATVEQRYYADNAAYAAGPSVPATFPTPAPGVTPCNPTATRVYMCVSITNPSGQTYAITTDASRGRYYVITDPTTYDAASLQRVPLGDPTTGALTQPTQYCTTCNHLGYGSIGGIFGFTP